MNSNEVIESNNKPAEEEILTNGLNPPWDKEHSIEKYRDGFYTKLTHGLTHYQLFEPIPSSDHPSGWEPRLIRNLTEKQSPIKKTKIVLCFHGITWWSISFHPVVQPLIEQGYTVLLFDWYGRGRSDTPDLPYTLDAFLGQAIDLIDHLHIESVYLIGYSMGGAVATLFAANFPQRLIKVILMAPAIVPVNVPFMARLVTMPYIGKFLFLMAGASSMINRLDTERFKNDVSDPSKIDPLIIDDLIAKVKWQILEKPRFMDAFHSTLYNISFSSGQLHLLPNIPSNLPISIILGTKDVIVPFEASQSLKSHLPHANIVTLESGHAFSVEMADQLAATLLENLN